MKEVILAVCHKQNDRWAEEVELRLCGALSDLHAADVRYHNDCKPAFMAPKAIQHAHTSKDTVDADEAFKEVISIMESDKERLWPKASKVSNCDIKYA